MLFNNISNDTFDTDIEENIIQILNKFCDYKSS